MGYGEPPRGVSESSPGGISRGAIRVFISVAFYNESVHEQIACHKYCVVLLDVPAENKMSNPTPTRAIDGVVLVREPENLKRHMLGEPGRMLGEPGQGPGGTARAWPSAPALIH